MRPIELEVVGFTAFRDPQRVDFSSFGLFVVTGPTGAGKTSVLDAMTLALYGQVARGGKHDVKSLISLGRSEAKVRLDFEAGSTRYRVARRFPRDGAQSAVLERFEEGHLIPEPLDGAGVKLVTRRIEKLIGLDFDAFTRAVLLPQGDFHRFLKGRPEDRKRILQRLLELGRYRMAARRAGEIEKADEARARMLEGHIEATYAGVTPERLESLRAAYEEAREHAAGLEKADKEGDALLRAIVEADALLARHCSLLGDLHRIEEEARGLEELKAALEPRQADIRALLDKRSRELEDARKEERVASESLGNVITQLGDAAALVRLEHAAQSLRMAVEEGDRIQADADDLRQSIERLTNEQESLAKEVEGLSKGANDAKVRYDATQKSLRTLQEAQAQGEILRKAVADAERLDTELEELRRSLEDLAAKRGRLGDEIEKRSSEVQAAKERRERASVAVQAAHELLQQAESAARMRAELAKATREFHDSETSFAEASAKERSAEEELGTARNHLRELEHANLAATVRESLTPGEPCPVCEQPVHELPPPSEGIENEIRRAKDQVKTAEEAHRRARARAGEARSAETAARTRLTGIEAALDELGEVRDAQEARGALQEAETALGVADVALTDAQTGLSELQLALKGAEATSRERVTSIPKLERDRAEAEGRASAARGALSTAFSEGVPGDLGGALERAEADAQKAGDVWEGARYSLADAETRLGTIDTQLQERRPRLSKMEENVGTQEARASRARETLVAAFPDGVPPDPEAEITSRRAKLAEAERAAGDARAALERARVALDDVLKQQKDLNLEAEGLRTGVATLGGQLTTLVAEAGKVGVEDLGTPGPGVPDLDALIELLSTARSGLDGANQRGAERKAEKLGELEALVCAAAGTQPDGTPPEVLRRELAGALEKAKQASAQAKNAAGRLEEDLARVAETRTKITELRASAERHHRLWVDLKSDNFLEFLLRETFQELADAASTELRRVSAGRYSLVSSGSEFLAVDHENADETRNVVTLSGGETFLASLSLALSLAGAVQDLAGSAAASRLDAIFIDEGFGALDPGMLEIVIDALERLQDGDRMVGVITHVRELADRIAAGLDVVPGTGGAGSRIVPRE